MKRNVINVLSGLLIMALLCLVGCGGGGGSNDSNTSATSNSSPPPTSENPANSNNPTTPTTSAPANLADIVGTWKTDQNTVFSIDANGRISGLQLTGSTTGTCYSSLGSGGFAESGGLTVSKTFDPFLLPSSTFSFTQASNQTSGDTTKTINATGTFVSGTQLTGDYTVSYNTSIATSVSVTSCSGSARRSWSATKQSTTPVTLPAAPSGLTANATSANFITLAWTDNSNNEDGFKIERKSGTNGTFTQIALVQSNVTSYLDIVLATETDYFYRVQATNIVGDSGDSNDRSNITSTPVRLKRFVDKGNGTIQDTVSNLIWLKNANCFGVQNWESAIAKSNSLANGQCGLSDGSTAGTWHLALRDEFKTFGTNRIFTETLTANGFTDVQTGSDDYWTATERATATAYSYYVFSGLDTAYSYKTKLKYVWPVRSAQ
jgi:hypothetical protein